MTPERWSRVRTVFFAALDVPPDLRGALLDREWNGDDALKDEILSLLGSSERAKNFLTRPAAEIAAGWADTDGIVPGRLGAWQLRHEIGRGACKRGGCAARGSPYKTMAGHRGPPS